MTVQESVLAALLTKGIQKETALYMIEYVQSRNQFNAALWNLEADKFASDNANLFTTLVDTVAGVPFICLADFIRAEKRISHCVKACAIVPLP